MQDPHPSQNRQKEADRAKSPLANKRSGEEFVSTHAMFRAIVESQKKTSTSSAPLRVTAIFAAMLVLLGLTIWFGSQENFLGPVFPWRQAVNRKVETTTRSEQTWKSATQKGMKVNPKNKIPTSPEVVFFPNAAEQEHDENRISSVEDLLLAIRLEEDSKDKKILVKKERERLSKWEDFEYLVRLAKAYSQAGNPDKAIRYGKKALELVAEGKKEEIKTILESFLGPMDTTNGD